MPIQIVLENDMMMVAVVAGLFSGVGSGLVFRYGATTGGTDISDVLSKKNSVSNLVRHYFLSMPWFLQRRWFTLIYNICFTRW